MRKKWIGGFILVMVVSIAAVNLQLNLKNSHFSDLALANIEALAQESGDTKKCTQTSKRIDDKEMCSYNPVRYRTSSGVSFTCKKEESGTATMCRTGFDGEIINQCTEERIVSTSTYGLCR